MMSIAYREGVKISPQALQEIIMASNNDIRQVCRKGSFVPLNVSSVLCTIECVLSPMYH